MTKPIYNNSPMHNSIFSSNLVDYVLKCLELNDTKRYTSTQCQNHSWSIEYFNAKLPPVDNLHIHTPGVSTQDGVKSDRKPSRNRSVANEGSEAEVLKAYTAALSRPNSGKARKASKDNIFTTHGSVSNIQNHTSGREREKRDMDETDDNISNIPIIKTAGNEYTSMMSEKERKLYHDMSFKHMQQHNSNVNPVNISTSVLIPSCLSKDEDEASSRLKSQTTPSSPLQQSHDGDDVSPLSPNILIPTHTMSSSMHMNGGAGMTTPQHGTQGSALLYSQTDPTHIHKPTNHVTTVAPIGSVTPNHTSNHHAPSHPANTTPNIGPPTHAVISLPPIAMNTPNISKAKKILKQGFVVLLLCYCNMQFMCVNLYRK